MTIPQAPAEARADTCQRRFHLRWGHLRDPHVRALAWLLDAPDLLDPAAPLWPGQIASIGALQPHAAAPWLAALDQAPQRLHDYLAIKPFTRLGRYAERLMAFYFEAQGVLRAHGVQVRADNNETIGEFDFLLQQGADLLHWEFATKFYLLEPSGAGQAADYFVGPNLADTLGNKLHKIFSRQLMLAQHPAAQPYLPQPVARAQALLKGWLFYRSREDAAVGTLGVAADHCRGFWCELTQVEQLDVQHAVILPRLSWLAPARVAPEQALGKAALQAALAQHFAGDSMPLLVALLEVDEGAAIEVARGFIVPDDWRARAGERRRPAIGGA